MLTDVGFGKFICGLRTLLDHLGRAGADGQVTLRQYVETGIILSGDDTFMGKARCSMLIPQMSFLPLMPLLMRASTSPHC